jgi:tetratricopeptide (TPR) repeat protein
VAIGVVLLAVALALAPSRAAAATPEAEREARGHFQAGEARFKAGAFDEALAEYQKGYEVLPLPGFLINVAQCQRRLGDLKKARATYQKFVLVAPDSPLVPQVRSMIAEIDGLLEKEKAPEAAPPESEAQPEVTPAPAPPAQPAVVATPTPVLVAAAPEPAKDEPTHHRWWLWGAIGAVVVGGAVAAIALSTGGTTTIHDGSLATLRR